MGTTTLRDVRDDANIARHRALLAQLLEPLDEEEPLWMIESRLRALMTCGDSGVCASMSEALLAIMEVSRAMPVDADAARCIPPEDFDVLITDIKDSDIMLIGEELEHANLSDSVDDGNFPVDGTFYGDHLRLFVALTVRKRTSRSDNCKWVLFLLDTGSPFTFLTHDTLRHLGFTESIPNITQVLINGVSLAVSPSHGHFHNVNLLGQNFMKAAQLTIQLDYAKGLVHMARNYTGQSGPAPFDPSEAA